MQELLAPLSVVTFKRRWKEHGTKETLAKETCILTGVPPLNLLKKLQRQSHKYQN